MTSQRGEYCQQRLDLVSILLILNPKFEEFSFDKQSWLGSMTSLSILKYNFHLLVEKIEEKR